jgi:oxygen-independent coproporphyrinogen III oxidase
MITPDVFAKYDVPVPRYTSYPTVPQWHAPPTRECWTASLQEAVAEPGAALAIYVHIPFCESLCTFCGCNTVITRDHRHEQPYVNLLLAELDIYLDAIGDLATTPLRQIHLGGGTPTFLSETALTTLIDGLQSRLPVRSQTFEGASEVDPRVTTRGQLQAMAARGFGRLSLGVQDIDPEVQRLVNRRQPLESTAAIVREARALGYESLNFDLIYGLPGQTVETMARLVSDVIDLAPDRLAVYGFARVPWIKPAQRKFRDDQVPAGTDKRALYEVARRLLFDAGYIEIGLDHFARTHDRLAQAAMNGRLHRNFMGYTDVRSTALLGLGVSGISETGGCYHQNAKVLPLYEKHVRAGEIPTFRGHVLSSDDRQRRREILELMTRFRVDIDVGDFQGVQHRLQPLVDDGLVSLEGHTLTVNDAGRPFLRNAASAFDAYLDGTVGPTYSRSV